ncbi:hypothetical protein H9P43_000175 [Blastocladiella emersonii ATCC 22665]|nr:hypothetical protein H9P43_000175 [Blastocladiella emersonii ATCC 22665]
MPTTTATQPDAPIMNRAAIDSGMYLLRRAADEDARGNRTTSLDLFFAGLDSLLFSLPVHDLDTDRRLDVQAKLLQVVDKIARVSGQYPVFTPDGVPVAAYPGGGAQPATSAAPFSGVPAYVGPNGEPIPPGYPVVVLGPGAPAHAQAAPPPVAPLYYSSTGAPVYPPHPHYAAVPPPHYAPAAYVHPPPTLSDTIITAAVAGAVALKQSPIPDAVTGALSAGIKSLQTLESTYKLRDKLVALGKASVTKAIDVDRQYQVHQKVGGALLTSLSAVTQATMAYKNAPSYKDVHPHHQLPPGATIEEVPEGMLPPPPAPPSIVAGMLPPPPPHASTSPTQSAGMLQYFRA